MIAGSARFYRRMPWWICAMKLPASIRTASTNGQDTSLSATVISWLTDVSCYERTTAIEPICRYSYSSIWVTTTWLCTRYRRTQAVKPRHAILVCFVNLRHMSTNASRRWLRRHHQTVWTCSKYALCWEWRLYALLRPLRLSILSSGVLYGLWTGMYWWIFQDPLIVQIKLRH